MAAVAVETWKHGPSWRSRLLAICTLVFFTVELLLYTSDVRSRTHQPQQQRSVPYHQILADEGNDTYQVEEEQAWRPRDEGNDTYQVEEEQAWRQRLFRETCYKYGLTESHVGDKNRIWLNHSNQALYCFIPKAGSRNLKNHWFTYTNRLRPAIVENNHLQKIGIETYQHNHRRDNSISVQGYYKIAFVRHPWTRLISGYRDKYAYGEPEYSYAQQVYSALGWNKCLSLGNRFWGETIKKKDFETSSKLQKKYLVSPRKARTHSGVKANETDINCYIHFVDLVNYIVTVAGRKQILTLLDRHWVPQYLVCDMCFLKYDFIGKVEHIYDDFAYVNNLLYDGEADIGKPRTKKQTEFDIVKDYFSAISLEHFKKLLALYEMDFKLFGYDPVIDGLYSDV